MNQPAPHVSRFFQPWCVFLAALALHLGCGGADGPPRYVVEGQVDFRGQPVPHGIIIFEPDAEHGNHGPGAGAVIEHGRYRVAPGVVGGPHRVRISGTDGVPVETPGEGVDPHGSPLFREYSTTVDLPRRRTTWNVEAP